jgi:hypothetical protein
VTPTPALLLPFALALSACGPVPLPLAERQCVERAKDARGPRGEVAIGASNRGAAGKMSVTLSSDYLMGRDPSVVFDQCVLQKSGQAPSRALYSRSDWPR